MRIIAGEHRGRRIEAPPGRGTRPMLDRVREAAFAALTDVLEGAGVLDLFAGSGSLGLEALSRGAARARFVERSGPACALLRRNVAALGLEDRAEVVRDDALAPRAWGLAEGADPAEAARDVVLLDPPYRMLREARPRAAVLGALATLGRDVVAPGGAVLLHVPRGAVGERDLPPGLAGRLRTYGTSDVWLLRAPAGVSEPPAGPEATEPPREAPR